jgi:hypothetical protein
VPPSSRNMKRKPSQPSVTLHIALCYIWTEPCKPHSLKAQRVKKREVEVAILAVVLLACGHAVA